MRGLKLLSPGLFIFAVWSHLLQMRGLKLWILNKKKGKVLSHLLQMRGLKLFFLSSNGALLGRIFYRCVD